MMANIGPRWRSDRGEKGGFGLRKRRPSVGGNGTVRRPCHNGGEKGGFELRKRRPSVGGHGTVRKPCHNGRDLRSAVMARSGDRAITGADRAITGYPMETERAPASNPRSR